MLHAAHCVPCLARHGACCTEWVICPSWPRCASPVHLKNSGLFSAQKIHSSSCSAQQDRRCVALPHGGWHTHSPEGSGYSEWWHLKRIDEFRVEQDVDDELNHLRVLRPELADVLQHALRATVCARPLQQSPLHRHNQLDRPGAARCTLHGLRSSIRHCTRYWLLHTQWRFTTSTALRCSTALRPLRPLQ